MLLSVLFAAAQAVEVLPTSDAQWVMTQWTVEDGLPLNHASDLVQGPRGFLWIATYDGLVRFDGLHFEVFRTQQHPGLPSNRLSSLAIDAAGVLWLLTEEGDLVRYQDRTFTAWPASGEAPPDLGFDLVSAGEDVWIVGQRGLTRLSDDGPERWRPDLLDDFVTSVFDAGDGDFWVGGADGKILRFGPDGAVADWSIPPSLDPQFISRLYRDGDGVMWASTRGGLFALRGGVWSRALPGLRQPVCEVLNGRDGEVLVRTVSSWLRLDEGGAVTLPGTPWAQCANGNPLSSGVRDGHLWRIAGGEVYRDEALIVSRDSEYQAIAWGADGELWLTTDAEVLLRLQPASVQPVPVTTRREQSVRSVQVDPDGTRWLVTADAFIRQDAEGESVLQVWKPGLAGQHSWAVYATAPAGAGATWLGGHMGLCLWREGACELHTTTDTIGLFTDPSGAVWVSDARGVRTLDGQVDVPMSSRRELVRSFAATSDGSVWMGTFGAGLLRAAGGAVRRLTTDDGLPSDRIRGMHALGASLWIATEDSGLCRLTVATEEIGCLGEAEGLYDESLHSVRSDAHGRLWMSSNQGVFWVRLGEAERVLRGAQSQVLSYHFTERDGMPTREANGQYYPQVAVEPDGRLLYPTQRGAVWFDPDRLFPPAPPLAVLESVRIDGVDVTEAVRAGPVVLRPEQRGVVVRWAAAAVNAGDRVRYRHRLVGYRDAWSAPSAERDMRLTQLPPGSYQLEVQAGLGGRWGETLALELERRPVLVETVWFPLGLGLLGVLGTGAAALLRGRQMRRRQAELEQIVSDRTRDVVVQNDALRDQADLLAQQADQLHEQNQRLAELDELKTRLIANISHELRTPTTLIMGPLDDLLERSWAPDVARTLSVLSRNARRLADLIEQLLDIARLDSGGLPLRARRSDLGAFVRRVSDRFTAACAHAGLTLRVETPPSPVPAFFDPEQLDLVISNLLSNALKFTPPGGAVALRLSAEEPDSPGAHAIISVTDTGIGVAADQQARLFERFYKVEQRAQGAGLGLALSHDLVALHGGDLSVDSVLGEGSTFTVRLPLGAAHLSPDEIDLSAAPPDAAAPPACDGPPPGADPGADTAVLIVEDHPDMRAYLAEFFRRHHRVFEARDGAEALRLLAEHRVDAVVSDVAMPGMGGLELARQIRAAPALAGLPIVLVSAHAGEADRLAGLAFANDYVQKPFQMRELLARVRGLIALRGRPGGAPEDAPPPAPALPQVDRELLARLRSAVERNLDTPRFGSSALAKRVGMSPRSLQRETQRLAGQNPTDFIRTIRLEAAQEMLQAGAFSTVGEVAAAVGFSRAHFSRLYAAWAGHPATTDLNTGA